MREALDDPHLLGRVMTDDTWLPWQTMLIAAMGEELTTDERTIFTRFTGRAHEPLQRVSEFAAAIGRRGRKTRSLALAGSYLAGLCDHSDTLHRGETGILLCIAQDQRVAKQLLDYIEKDFTGSPVLRQLIRGRTTDAIELSGQINIEVRPASFRKLRGPTYIGVICDELAFWWTDTSFANPDTEILAAVRPGLLTTRGPLLLASSPYARRGALWDVYRKHFGPDGSPSILVAQGTTRDFNSTVSQAEIDRALQDDPVRNRAEFLAEFRSDVEGFLNLETVERCVGDYLELPPAADTTYFAFTDPSSGSVGGDDFVLAIAHRDGERIIIDAIRERRPWFSPEAVITEFCALLKSYRVTSVNGDRYAGGFPPEQFLKHGVRFDPSQKPKSDIYGDFLPVLNAGRVLLPRHDRMISQFVSLERSVTRGSGRDVIDHPRGMHDDIANAVAGAVLAAARPSYDSSGDWIGDMSTVINPRGLWGMPLVIAGGV